MDPSHPDVTLAILAGGRARRLQGLPKGLLRLEGRTLLERLLDLAPGLGGVLLSTGDPSPYAAFGLTAIPDRVAERGAPGGVHAALAAASTPWVLAVACDMPWVARPAAELLLRERDPEVDLVCFEVQGRLQPFPGVYRTSLAERWGAMLAKEPSFRELAGRFRARRLPEERLRAVDPELRTVRSVNTLQEAEAGGIELPRASS